jgi:hypothetical protein
MLFVLLTLLPVSVVPPPLATAEGTRVDPWSAPPLVAALPEPGKENLLEVEALTARGAATPSIEAAAAEPVLVTVVPREVSQSVADLPVFPSDRSPLLGLAVEAGIPDGVAVTAMLNPTRWLRLQVSGLGNSISYGVRGGVVLMAPWKYFRPLLGLEGGFYLGGNANWLIGPSAPAWAQELLGRVSYAFANGHGGFEVGSTTFSFTLRGGVSYLDLALGAPMETIGSLKSSGSHLSGFVPSARLSLQWCFM